MARKSPLKPYEIAKMTNSNLSLTSSFQRTNSAPNQLLNKADQNSSIAINNRNNNNEIIRVNQNNNTNYNYSNNMNNSNTSSLTSTKPALPPRDSSISSYRSLARSSWDRPRSTWLSRYYDDDRYGGYGGYYGGYGRDYWSRYGGYGYGGYGYGYGCGYGYGYDKYDGPLFGQPRWMNDFQLVTEGFARFSSLLSDNFSAIHSSFSSIAAFVERFTILWREIGYIISGFTLFRFITALFGKFSHIFQLVLGRKLNQLSSGAATAGFDIKSFNEFEKSQNQLAEREPQRSNRTSNTIVTLIGLTLIGGPIFLMILERFAAWLRPRNSLENAWSDHNREDDRNNDVFPIRAQALYDYQSPESGDLNFKKGDIILILQKPHEQWWEGALAHNPREVGLFPANYVEELRENRF
jgi:hypothetical protein